MSHSVTPGLSAVADAPSLSPRSASRLMMVGGLGALLGVVWAIVAAAFDIERFAHAYLVGFCFVASLALGALFFILIQLISRAGWSVASRRHAEWMAGGMVLVMLLFLPLIPWGPIVWSEWMGSGHALGHGKELYLNPNFFYARAAGYLIIWSLLAKYFARRSQAQDITGDPALLKRMQAMSAPALVIFALTLTLASFDWLMSLDPHWYSTIFGVYVFSGAAVAAFAALVLIALLFQRAGLLRGVLSVEHRQDLGKYLFAFTVFYAYIAFCQYFLIWYANIPEETIFYLQRWEGNGKFVGMLLIALRFAIPFLLLLSRAGKRYALPLGLAAVSALAGQYVDLFWLVMPKLDPGHFHFGWIEAGALVGPLGLYGLWMAVQATRSRLYPVNDPRLSEALHFENG